MQIFKKTIYTNYITSHLLTDSDSSEYNYYNNEIINNIVKRMDTMLKTPETILIKQDELIDKEKDEIYFIAKGRCNVIVTDKFQDRSEEKICRYLDAGDHFGEISMLYQCKKSASVIASNYITCAKISRANYSELE